MFYVIPLWMICSLFNSIFISWDSCNFSVSKRTENFVFDLVMHCSDGLVGTFGRVN